MRPPDPSSVRVPGSWTHREVSANGIRLHIAEAGRGPLVLLLHGFPESWWSWRFQLTAFAEAGLHAVALDLRGYGDSDKPPRGYDLWTLAGDVAGLVRALGGTRAALVGHDWGGLIAWCVAALHPRSVSSVAVLAAPHPLALRRAWIRDRGQRRASRFVAGFQVPMLPERRLVRDGGAHVEHILRSWGGPRWTSDPGFAEVTRYNRAAMTIPGAAHSACEYYRWLVRSQLRPDGHRFAAAIGHRIAVPVLQLQGTADPCVLERTARGSEVWTAGDHRYHALDGVGHFVHQEEPVLTNSLITGFLAAHHHP